MRILIMNIDRKKQIISEYKNRKVEIGLIQIKNIQNGYSFIDTCKDLGNPFEGIKFKLKNNSFKNKKLQEEYIKYGEESFSIEIVAKMNREDDITADQLNNELKELYNIYIGENKDVLKLYD